MKRGVAALVIALAVLAAGAAGAVVSAVVVPRGQPADFAGSHWRCLNAGRVSPGAISCFSGDARPYVELSNRGLAVRVFNLRRACSRRVLRQSPDPGDPQMKPYYEYVYTFKPFGC